MSSNISGPPIARGNRNGALLLLTAGLLSMTAIVAPLSLFSTKLALGSLAAWTFLIWICVCFAKRHFDWIVMAWLTVFPFCYYLFSFPRERPLFTVDRAFVLLVLLVLITGARHVQAIPLHADIRTAAYLWGAYLFACVLSLWGHSIADVLGSYRLIVDGMVL